MNELLQILFLSLATAAISVTITKAKVFASMRNWVGARSQWLGSLVTCTYCTSHWVAIGFVAIYQPILFPKLFLVDLIASVFAIVAVSSFLATIIAKLMLSPTPPSTDLQLEVAQLKQSLANAQKALIQQAKVIEELRQ